MKNYFKRILRAELEITSIMGQYLEINNIGIFTYLNLLTKTKIHICRSTMDIFGKIIMLKMIMIIQVLVEIQITVEPSE